MTTYTVRIGDLVLGPGAPVAVQSMTNTCTADIEETAAQVFPWWATSIITAIYS